MQATLDPTKEAAQCSREELISSNLGLVHACAHKLMGRGIEYDDLFQAGCIGIIKAADAFDPERGVRFSTYAVPVILVSELAVLLGRSEEAVVEASCVSAPVLSLSADDDGEYGGQIDLPVESPEEKLSENLSLGQALERLDKADRMLIYLRYYKLLTQTQTASRLGMTQVQVSRREKKIIGMLRQDFA